MHKNSIKSPIIDGEEYVNLKYCATFLNVGLQRVKDFIKSQRLKTLKIGKI